MNEFFCSMSEEEILNVLNRQKQELTLCAAAGKTLKESKAGRILGTAVDAKSQKIMILKARFVKDGKILYFVVNNSETDAEVFWSFEGKENVEIWDPSDGSINIVKAGEKVELVSYRGKFFVFG